MTNSRNVLLCTLRTTRSAERFRLRESWLWRRVRRRPWCTARCRYNGSGGPRLSQRLFIGPATYGRSASWPGVWERRCSTRTANVDTNHLLQLFSVSDSPYDTINRRRDIIENLKGDNRPSAPPTAPMTVRQMMADCWKVHPALRPTMAALWSELRNIWGNFQQWILFLPHMALAWFSLHCSCFLNA